MTHNGFLATEKSYGDFILKLAFRLINGEGNSGVQFRSVRVPGHEMSGYQADIGQGYWGSLYDESRRNRVLKAASDRALETLHKTDWNEYVVRAMGSQVRLSFNGVPSVEYVETDKEIARTGKIDVQIHAGGPMEVQFKDVLIQPLPTPDEPASASDSAKPGFHLRTVKTDKGERKYTVFVPNGYDGRKSFPIALFLHGRASGARTA
jgi:3-keto-disaccharide hydrolase